jgi:hypothetical protein
MLLRLLLRLIWLLRLLLGLIWLLWLLRLLCRLGLRLLRLRHLLLPLRNKLSILLRVRLCTELRIVRRSSWLCTLSGLHCLTWIWRCIRVSCHLLTGSGLLRKLLDALF